MKPILQPSARAARAKPQRGAFVLEIALVILLLVVVVGLAAMRGTLMQDKMTSNFYDRQIAFQAAQAGLRLGEAAVAAASPGAGAFWDCSPNAAHNCLPNPFSSNSSVPATQIISVDSRDFPATNGFSPPLANSLPASAAALLDNQNPQYVVEYLGSFSTPAQASFQIKTQCSNYNACGNASSADYYRITARNNDPATASPDRATVTLQSIYRN